MIDLIRKSLRLKSLRHTIFMDFCQSNNGLMQNRIRDRTVKFLKAWFASEQNISWNIQASQYKLYWWKVNLMMPFMQVYPWPSEESRARQSTCTQFPWVRWSLSAIRCRREVLDSYLEENNSELSFKCSDFIPALFWYWLIFQVDRRRKELRVKIYSWKHVSGMHVDLSVQFFHSL